MQAGQSQGLSAKDTAALQNSAANMGRTVLAGERLTHDISVAGGKQVNDMIGDLDPKNASDRDSIITGLSPLIQQGNKAALSSARQLMADLVLKEGDVNFAQLFIPDFLPGGTERGLIDFVTSGFKVDAESGGVGGGTFDKIQIDNGIVKTAEGEVMFDEDVLSPAALTLLQRLIEMDTPQQEPAEQTGLRGG
jgi:hypothetical protein